MNTPQTLLIDVGNTRIKWYLHSANTPVLATTSGHALPHTNQLPHELTTQWHTLPTPDEVRISHVAQTVLYEQLIGLVQQLWGTVRIVRMTPRATHQWLQLNYDQSQMGSDRYAQLLGARALNANDNLVVIGAGTAITVDAIQANGQHIGGIILPSARLMRTSLHQYTAQLPLTGGAFSINDAPHNTRDALHTGAILASVGAIEFFVRTYFAQMDAQVLLCGGDAPELIQHLQAVSTLQNITHAPALGLLGLLNT
ncbi:MAG: coaX [Burkholderiaceae bacterium]|nr:coaX [Burkholderiaceae bacterium]